MKATAHYMAAYLLALYQCSKKGQNKQGDVVRFAEAITSMASAKTLSTL